MCDTLPELMGLYPLGLINKCIVPGEKFIVDGYMYANQKWYAMYRWMDAWYTEEDLKQKFN